MKKILFFLLGIIFLSTPTFAQLYQYSAGIEILENFTTHHTTNLIFIKPQTEKITLLIEKPIYGLNINSTIDCETQKVIFGIEIICNLSKGGEKFNILIDYYSDNYVKRMFNYFVFSDSYKMPIDSDDLFVVVKLPEGTGLIKTEQDIAYSPKGALIGSDGRRTIISWQKGNLTKENIFDVSIAFERIGEVAGIYFILPTAIIIGITVLISGLFYQFYWKSRNIKLILPILKKDEKIIFDSIIKHGNGVNQKIIVRDSKYSKAKVSKVLNSLKERGILRLERIGRSNKVYIEKNFEKKVS